DHTRRRRRTEVALRGVTANDTKAGAPGRRPSLVACRAALSRVATLEPPPGLLHPPGGGDGHRVHHLPPRRPSLEVDVKPAGDLLAHRARHAIRPGAHGAGVLLAAVLEDVRRLRIERRLVPEDRGVVAHPLLRRDLRGEHD